MQINHTPFLSFAPDSRVWIFQSLQPLSVEQKAAFHTHLDRFITQWTAHQAKLTSAFGIYFNHVLVIAADAAGNAPTGCSIDTLHQTIEEIARSVRVDLFDRLHIPVLKDENIHFLTRKQLREELSTGSMDENTLILDQTILDLDTWKRFWVKPVGQSWVMQRIPARPA